MIDSEGREREEYGGIRVLDKGKLVRKVILADNEPTGKWTIEVKERISGEQIEVMFSVN